MFIRKKIKPYACFAAAFLALALLFPLSETEAKAAVKGIAMGDSIAAHNGLPIQKGFVHIISDLLELHGIENEFGNIAINGYLSGQLLLQLETDINKARVRNADIILVSIGTNNLWAMMDVLTEQKDMVEVLTLAVQFSEDIHTLIRLFNELAPNAHTCIYTLYNPLPEDSVIYNDMEWLLSVMNGFIEMNSETLGYTVIDNYSIFKNVGRKTHNFDTANDIHPSEIGHYNIAVYTLGQILGRDLYSDW